MSLILRENADCNSTVTCLAGNDDEEGDNFYDTVEKWAFECMESCQL
jgi:hypothetical protein